MTYLAGKYSIKYRGRGIIYAILSASQAKALFELLREDKLEIESIHLIKN